MPPNCDCMACIRRSTFCLFFPQSKICNGKAHALVTETEPLGKKWMVIFSPQEKRLTVAEAAMVWLVSCRIVHPNACKLALTAPRRSTEGFDPAEKCKVCSAGNPNAIITTSLSFLGHSISGDIASTLECKKSLPTKTPANLSAAKSHECFLIMQFLNYAVMPKQI